MFVFLSIIALLLGVIHIIFNYNVKARMLKKIPGPRDAFIIGNALAIMVSAEELMKLGRKWSQKWKRIFRIWSFPIGAVHIYNPEDIEIVISSMKYNDKSPIYNILKPWLRNGLLVSNGEKWQQRRKLLTPAFHFNILRQFFIILQENSVRLVERLDKSLEEPVDVVPVLSEFTLHSICETAMGTQLSDGTTDEAMSYKASIYDIGRVLIYRFIRLYLYSDFVFFLTSAGRAMKKYLKVVHRFTERVIKDRRDYIDKYGIQLTDDDVDQDDVVYKQKRKTAMLDLLLLAEKDGHIDNAGIQEEVDTFMFEVGQKFAMMEMKSAVSEILRKFVLKPVTHPDDIEFTADLVLRNVRPVYVTFSKR